MAEGNTSSLLLDEYFSSQDPQFLETLRQVRGHIKLAAFTDRWKKDPRPWAREQMLEYIGMPLSSMDHQPVIKRLFKHAEENKDDEVMGAFFVAFDRLVR